MKKLYVVGFALLFTILIYPQWMQTNGPYGGKVNHLAVSNTNLFAGTDGGGIYFSSNQGKNWMPVNTGLPPNMSVSALAVSNTNLYAGSWKDGVFLSTDQGKSWSDLSSGLPFKNVMDLTISVNEAGGTDLFVYVHNDYFGDGIFSSTSNGDNWTAIFADDSSWFFNPICIESVYDNTTGKNLFIGITYSGLLRLRENDTSWIVDTVLTNTSVHCLVVDYKNLFVGTENGVIISTDMGDSWTELNNGIPLGTHIFDLEVHGTRLIAISHEGMEEFIYFSSDYGMNWSLTNPGLHNPYVSPFIRDFAMVGDSLFAGTSKGVFVSIDNAANWVEVSTGIMNNWIYDIIDIPSGPNQTSLIMSDGDGVYLSSDGGINWNEINKFSDFAIFSFIVCTNTIGGNNLLAGGNGVFFSTDNGISWSNSGLTDTRVFCFAVRDSNLFAGTERNGAYLSTDKGASWTPANSGLKIDPYNYSAIRFLKFKGTNLIAGTGRGVFLSTNNGTNWIDVSGDLPKDDNGNYFIRDLLVNGSELLLSTGKYDIFVSTNNGTTWTKINSELEDLDVMTFAISPDSMTIFAGTYGGGIYFSKDNGRSWLKANSGLTNLNIVKLFVSPDGINLFAGTGQSGLWYRPLTEMLNQIPVELTSFTATANGKEITLSWSTATELNNQGFEVQRKFSSNDFVTVGSVKGNGTTTSPNLYSFLDKLIDGGKYFYRLRQIDFDGTFEYSNVIEVEVRTVDKFTLEQNYPNPFNPTTTIGYVLQEKSNTKLTLLNTICEEIAVLINEEQDRGYHKVEFNGAKLSSGVYFYQLKAGNFIEMRKMILLK